MLAGLGGCDADRAWERAIGEDDSLPKPHETGSRIELRDAKPRVRVLVGEEPEFGNDRRPSPVARLELEKVDDEHVARPGALDEEGAADRIDVSEIELQDVFGARGGVNLLVRRVPEVELDDVARIQLERGLDRVVPDVVERVAAEIVDRSSVEIGHEASPRELEPGHYRASLRAEQAGP